MQFQLQLKYAALAITAVAGLSMTACSPRESEPVFDPAALARLNYESSTIMFPIGAYELTHEDQRLLSRAAESSISQCMASKGVAAPQKARETTPEDRLYGLWNVERARAYGFAYPGETMPSLVGRESGAADESSSPEERIRMACGDELHDVLASFVPPDDISNSGVAEKVKSAAYTSASHDPSWRISVDAFRACLRERGLEPRTGQGEWGTKQDLVYFSKSTLTPAEQEEFLRIAVTEAECNRDTGLTQKLANLEAGYQAPLIKKHQAALNEEMAKYRGYLEAARRYLATHG